MDYKVLVGCMTYNHSQYIVDALNGFAMQQTDFPFACIVMDDASTDGEPEVIKEWLQKECDMEQAHFYDLELAHAIIVPHRANANCTMAAYLLKRNLYNEERLKYDLVKDWGSHSEYLALCEGDDYWTDSEKLQIQSDCLDAHPEVDICAHSYQEKHALTGRIIGRIRRRRKDCTIPVSEVILRGGGYFATASILYRIEIEQNIPQYKQYMPYDYTNLIHAASRGGTFYLDRNMAIYRRFVPQSWCSQLGIKKEAQKYYYQKCIFMLKMLNEEYHYTYNNSVNAAILIHSVVSPNNWKENIISTWQYRKYFRFLPLYHKIRIISRCCCPFISSNMFSFQKNRKEKR